MRRLAGRSVSGLGFGGYRISSAVREHRAALIAALDHGASVVDTSPNYADSGSETLIGSVLAGRRECRPVVVTKVGTLQGEQLADAVAREQAGNPWPDVVKMSASAWVCLAPEFIAHSLAGSTQRLGAPPDVVLLHNPELVLADMHRRGALSDAAIDSFYERMLPRAFAALEAQLPGLSCYGVSANTTGCRWGALGGANEREALDLRRTLDAAAKAAKAASLEGGGGGGRDGGEARGGRGGGEAQHRCRVLQMPLNLLEPDAAAAPAALARRLGLSVMANPPGVGFGLGLGLGLGCRLLEDLEAAGATGDDEPAAARHPTPRRRPRLRPQPQVSSPEPEPEPEPEPQLWP
jgi:aryl-alcohol dehydrogenase-like predicted oxidoreductase